MEDRLRQSSENRLENRFEGLRLEGQVETHLQSV